MSNTRATVRGILLSALAGALFWATMYGCWLVAVR